METKTVDREAVLKSLAQSDPNTDGQPRKRRRLDNLSSEERALRRKLKNRVAAQTARDRKKARMTDLEEAVERLEEENKTLRLQNQRLVKQTENLSHEVTDLRVRLGVTPPVSPGTDSQSLPPSPVPSPQPQETQESTKDSQVVIKKEAEFTEHAALSVSQQKKHLILFLSMITTWLLVNNSLVTWETVDQLKNEKEWEFFSELTLSLLEPIEQDGTTALLLQPKPEDKLSSACCQHNVPDSDGKLCGIAEEANQECRRDLASLMDHASETFDTLDDLLACKDITKELKQVDAEQGTLGNDMWWEESFTELFPSLLAV